MGERVWRDGKSDNNTAGLPTSSDNCCPFQSFYSVLVSHQSIVCCVVDKHIENNSIIDLVYFDYKKCEEEKCAGMFDLGKVSTMLRSQAFKQYRPCVVCSLHVFTSVLLSC